MRLAWFTPWPPQRSGVAGRSFEVVAALCELGHAIDVFVDEREVGVHAVRDRTPPTPGEHRVQSAHDFVWRDAQRQYDLNVYQVGNSELHRFIWPYLFRWPGLSVLHDARLHHARGRALLARRAVDAYRVEFAWSHPQLSRDAAELAIAGFDGPYYYQWPMTRGVVAASCLVAAHARGAVEELEQQWPDRAFDYIALGEGRRDWPGEGHRQAVRNAMRVPEDAVVFGVFGALTREKRVEQVIRAFATTRAAAPHAWLVLAGKPEAFLDLDALTRSAGVHDYTRVLEPLGDDEFDDAIAAVDVSLNLRWPTALETSGPWLRALAAGRATVIVDVAHRAEIPTLDPRTWKPHSPPPPAGVEPIAVAIDILDEDHSLRRAMYRLAVDRELRHQLGRAARRYWETEHTVERIVADYERVLARATGLAIGQIDLPNHMRPDPLEYGRELTAPFGDAGQAAERDFRTATARRP